VTTRPELSAQRREVTGKAVARLRKHGVLPAVLFGHGEDSRPIQVDTRAFETLYRRAGRNALIDLRLDGGRPRTVILHGVQEHPVRRNPLHVDLMLVKMTEELTVDVPIELVGEAPAVAKLEGTLLQTLDRVRVRALPNDLPHVMEVDVSGLVDFEASVHVRDLALPPNVTVLTEAGEVVAHVKPPRVEAVEAPTPAEAGPTAPTEAEGAAAAPSPTGAGGE
jgi:large subunit ribosomal protein L25